MKELKEQKDRVHELEGFINSYKHSIFNTRRGDPVDIDVTNMRSHILPEDFVNGQ